MFWMHLSTVGKTHNRIVRVTEVNNNNAKVVCIATGKTRTVDAMFLRPTVKADWSR